jgi:hypothetical protein
MLKCLKCDVCKERPAAFMVETTITPLSDEIHASARAAFGEALGATSRFPLCEWCVRAMNAGASVVRRELKVK